jgi:hypothetical protein
MALIGFLVVGCTVTDSSDDRASGDLARRVADFASGLTADAPYRPPTSAERDIALGGLRPLLTGADDVDASARALEPLGFTVEEGTDHSTGRRYVLASTKPGAERGWGMYLADPTVPPRLVIEVPHPNSDLATEKLGMELFRRVPGSVVLIAGAHRRAANAMADVAHRTDSLFHAVALDLAATGLPQVQLHGFDGDSLPDKDIVVSTGAAEPGPAAERVAAHAETGGLATCRAWTDDCGLLEGTKNVQGQAAAEHDTLFLHIEVTGRLREEVAFRGQVADVLAAADIPAG